jgi:hypothetical protein
MGGRVQVLCGAPRGNGRDPQRVVQRVMQLLHPVHQPVEEPQVPAEQPDVVRRETERQPLTDPGTGCA